MDLLWVVLISVVAHVSIAWTAIAYHTRRAERKWDRKVNDEMIPAASTAAANSVAARLGLAEDDDEPLKFPSAKEIVDASASEVERRVAVMLTNLDFSAVATQVWERIEAGFEGKAGAAVKAADKNAGSAIVKELAAIDWGSPALNGIWAVFVAAQGQRIITTIGRVARRLPVLGPALEDGGAQDAQWFALPGENESSQVTFG